MYRRCEIQRRIKIIAEGCAERRLITFAHSDLINEGRPTAFTIIGEQFGECANFCL